MIPVSMFVLSTALYAVLWGYQMSRTKKVERKLDSALCALGCYCAKFGKLTIDDFRKITSNHVTIKLQK